MGAGLPAKKATRSVRKLERRQLKPLAHGQGKRLVVSGTSYLQLVSFTDKGPQARGLLAFSQSSEAASVHAGDQTKAFAAGKLAVIPFTEAQIKADPEYREVVISERDKGAVVSRP
ncbi:penicillin acylase family protein [Pseudomonas asiatica]|nr:penicillin acylase family protein [Pseudomonas asiatica]WJD72793.1 penicillin acylase family protein [Pseudomonas asiatica]